MKQLASNLDDPVLQERVEYAVYLALMYRQPDHAEMQDYENRVWNIVMYGNNNQVKIQAASQLLLYLTRWRGEFNKAEILVNAMQPVMDELATRPMIKITWHVMLSIYYGAIFKADECRENIRIGIQLSDQTGMYNWKPMLYLQASFLHLHYGKTTESTYYLEQLNTIKQPERILEQAIYYFYRAWYELHDGYTEAVEINILLAKKFARQAGNSIVELAIQIAYAQFLLQQGKKNQGSKLIHKTRKKALQINAKSLLVQTYIAEAIYFLYTDEKNVSVSLLKNIFTTTKIFSAGWWRNEDMAKLCAQALHNNIEVEYVEELIARHNLRSPVGQYDADKWPYSIKIYTFGQFRLVVNNQLVKSSGKVQKKPLDLLKSLIAMGGKEVRDNQLTDFLWPDAEGDAAYDSLRTTVRRLRLLLKQKEAVIFTEGKISLNPQYCWVDAWSFERMTGLKNTNQQSLEKAMSFYTGTFMASEADHTWISSVRERLGRKFIKITADLGSQYEKQGQWQLAIEVYQRGLNIDDIAEVFYQGLIRCNINLGEQAAAKIAFQQCEQLLNTKLNTSPSKATLAIFAKIIGV